MTKRKQANTTEAAKTPRKASSLPIQLRFLAILSTVIIVTIAALILLIQQQFDAFSHDINRAQTQTMAQNIQSSYTQQIAHTEERLKALAENSQVVTASQGDAAQREQLATLLKHIFADSFSVQIIPWDHTITVGLREKGIQLSNLETLMLTRAGSGKAAAIETYQADKQWRVVFAQPIHVSGAVKAIILLTLDSQYLQHVADSEWAKNHLAIRIINSKNNQRIAGNTNAIQGDSINLALPITDTQLQVTQIHNLLAGQSIAQTIILLLLIAGIIFVFSLFIAYITAKKLLTNDVDALIHYADTLKGLHENKLAKLNYGELLAIAPSLDALSKHLRFSVIPADNSQAQKTINEAIVNAKPSTVNNIEVRESTPFSHPHIFRNYDIRGEAQSALSDKNVILVGKAIGSEAKAQKIDTLVVGRDGRLSADRVFNALTQGINSTGCHVVDAGVVPTPVLYFACKQHPSHSGIMITASHNGPQDNGFKIVLNNKTYFGADIEKLLARIEAEDFVQAQTTGQLSRHDYESEYEQAISNDILIAKPMKIIIDAGNGVAGPLACKLFQQHNCEIIPLFCDIDGNFPHHAPDPSKAENLTALQSAIMSHQADLGIAFDGDGDRMVAVTAGGEIIEGDKLLMIFAEDVLSRNPAANVVFDIKCSKHLPAMISQHGGKPIMWKTGHANIKAKMQETKALLAGEYTGHFFFQERWLGFDDGIYAALRLVELLGNTNQTLELYLTKLPQSIASPEYTIATSDDKSKFDIMRRLQLALSTEEGQINNLDGIRIDYDEGWGLIRASNTQAALSARFEADNQETLATIQNAFRQAIADAEPQLNLPF